MSWKTPFILGRPGAEYSFEINPEAMAIDEAGVVVLQRNLNGDLKKSTLKINTPSIKINSSFLSFQQRNQFNSLIGVADTFLSFQTRTDWTQYNDLAQVIDTTHFKLTNSSALRLSKALVQLGFSSIITITGISISPANGAAWEQGAWGAFPWMGTYNPGTITYNDLTYIVTVQNPIPDLTYAVFITYTYTGWLVNMQKMNSQYQGGWLDRAKYDFQLEGA